MKISPKNQNSVCRRVLLIDDRRDAIFPVQRMLELAGHHVFTALDGSIGLEMARRLVPDVIFCDIGLPGGISGFDVAEAIRSSPELKDAYLVAVSGYDEDEDRRQARRSGFDNHVSKPLSKETLDMLLAGFPRFAELAAEPQA